MVEIPGWNIELGKSKALKIASTTSKIEKFNEIYNFESLFDLGICEK